MNVANFAIAVTHVCEKVLSPADGTPIKLRIGVNSGRCCSGIVGVTNPRYCVFGDTVNTTARHETTGEAGRVHGSMTTMIELLKQAPNEFFSESRGMVEMKGKGSIPTYWLSSTDDNPSTNKEALKALDEEVTAKFGHMLKQNECLARQKKKTPGPKTTGMDDKSKRNNVESGCVPSRPPAVSPQRQNNAPRKESTAHHKQINIPRKQMSRIESSSLDTTDHSVTSSVSCTSSYMSSYSSSSRSSSSLFSPGGDRCNYIPSKGELMNMLGQLIDGDADIDDLVVSVGENFDGQMLNGLNDAVHEALRLLDDEECE
jgi:Adenylate and Guanylate cyclase catalytic domain